MNIFAFLSLFSFVLILLIGIYAYSRHPLNKLNRIFLFLCLFQLYYAFIEFQYRTSESLANAVFWMNSGAFWHIILPIQLHLIILFTEKEKLLKKIPFYLSTYLPAFIFSVLHLFIGESSMTPLRDIRFGWTFVLHKNFLNTCLKFPWIFIMLFTSLFLAFQYWKKASIKAIKKSAQYIAIGYLLPVVSLVMILILKYFQISFPNISTFFLAIGYCIISIAIWKNKFPQFSVSSLEEAVTTMSDSLIILKPDGSIEQVNQAALHLLGFDKTQIIGRPLVHFLSNPSQNEFKKILGRINQKKSVTDIIVEIANPLKTIHVSLSLTAVPLEENEFINKILCVARDITYRIQMENALKESKEHFQLVFEYAPDGYYLSDLKGTILDGNKAAEELVGYKKEELIGKSFLKLNLLSAKYIPKAIKLLGQNAMGNPTGPDEFVLIRKDGNQVTLEIRTYPIKMGDKIVVLGIARNISERKRMEEDLKKHHDHLEQLVSDRTIKLQEAKEKAERADHIKSEFVANVSHELRTPLTGILGFTKLLLDSEIEHLNEDQIDHINTIYESATKLLKLINSLLDFSKIESGVLAVTLESFHLEKIFQGLENLFRPAMQEKKIQFNIEKDSDIPDRIICDFQKLNQILINLISNAIKFTEKGSITLKVFLNENSIHFDVTDTGIGIRKKDLDFIFEPFRQVDGSLARQYEGSGLGLTICKQMAELIDGTIGIKSKPGRGTCVTVSIPFKT